MFKKLFLVLTLGLFLLSGCVHSSIQTTTGATMHVVYPEKFEIGWIQIMPVWVTGAKADEEFYLDYVSPNAGIVVQKIDTSNPVVLAPWSSDLAGFSNAQMYLSQLKPDGTFVQVGQMDHIIFNEVKDIGSLNAQLVLADYTEEKEDNGYTRAQVDYVIYFRDAEAGLTFCYVEDFCSPLEVNGDHVSLAFSADEELNQTWTIMEVETGKVLVFNIHIDGNDLTTLKKAIDPSQYMEIKK